MAKASMMMQCDLALCFTETLLGCRSFMVANLSFRGHCAKAEEHFLVCRGVRNCWIS